MVGPSSGVPGGTGVLVRVGSGVGDATPPAGPSVGDGEGVGSAGG
jgi:hypothetical protein